MPAARCVSRLLILSFLTRLAQVGAEPRGLEEPVCLGQCPVTPHIATVKPSGDRVGSSRAREALSQGSKCKCICSIEPSGTVGEQRKARPPAPTLDLVSIQAMAANLQGILDHAETKRLNAFSAKLTGQLRKLEKRLDRNKPSVCTQLRETLARVVQHQEIFQHLFVTIGGMREEMSKLNLLLQELAKDTDKVNQIHVSFPNGKPTEGAVHQQSSDPQAPGGSQPTKRSHPPTHRTAVSTPAAVVRRPPANNKNTIREDGCVGTPVMIGGPTTHNRYGRAQGAWMKDPVVHQERVYVANYFFGTTLTEFRSLEHFKLGRWLNTYKLPYSWMGTGHAVYNGSFYYHKAYTRSIIRYDLRKRAAASWSSLGDLTIGLSTLTGWKGYSEVDFTVDEGGLWVTYFSNDYGYLPEEVLVLSRLDPIDLTTRKETTWKTRVTRASYGNSFLICGVLYAMDLGHGEGTVTYAFDTHTGFESNPGLRIQSEHSLLTQVDYNPADKLLYTWDNGYQATYSVRFAF
ncbi:olfactomedin-like protein 2A [Hypanus sabinus]|uniref:olfactomedin-like protein 2A n=1 Tax=Hypanus sabinus TaxID=79690 RepID=UPI0028C4930C|nr:olfactomedin-like protein 2A [Hypanus sabinus]